MINSTHRTWKLNISIEDKMVGSDEKKVSMLGETIPFPNREFATKFSGIHLILPLGYFFF